MVASKQVGRGGFILVHINSCGHGRLLRRWRYYQSVFLLTKKSLVIY